MAIDTTMSVQDQIAVQNAVNLQNSKNLAEAGKATNQSLGKDDFLKLLITQLSNQDPTSPMENTEFIAQMAQFSSLEQMTNMATSFTELANMLTASEASNVIGRTVEVDLNGQIMTGQVEAATRGTNPSVQINGMLYSMDQITKVYAD
ncbi:MAG: flagellar hook assembly protein FlgD [Treponema sp.]|nr:flagellar hook assembly protein FlgD [Candidatus Treponema caballi]